MLGSFWPGQLGSLIPCVRRTIPRQTENHSHSPGEYLIHTVHCYWLQGCQFDSFTDHRPLIPIYSGKKRNSQSATLSRCRDSTCSTQWHIFRGKNNPCKSAMTCHDTLYPLKATPKSNLHNLVVTNNGDKFWISRAVTGDLPGAVLDDGTACLKAGHSLTLWHI